MYIAHSVIVYVFFFNQIILYMSNWGTVFDCADDCTEAMGQMKRLWMRAPHITQLDRDVYIFHIMLRIMHLLIC